MALSPTEESLVRQLIAQNPALLNLASSESTIISKLGATKVSLSDLSAATSLSDADLALVRQGLNDKSFAMSVLSDYVNSKLPAASETVAGIIEIATSAEAQALTDDVRALTPAKLAAVLDATSLGRGQIWQDLTASRSLNVTYTNSTGRPIMVVVNYQATWPGIRLLKVDGNTADGQIISTTWNGVMALKAIVPHGSTYIADGTSLGVWLELR